jgi:putative glutamine amidotransferase
VPRKLVIGIMSGFDPARRWFGCKPEYIRAVTAAGAVPLIIPYTPNTDDAEVILELVDGVILTGGEDAVDPARFGAGMHPKVKWVNPDRDEFEIRLVTAALERDRAVLGICRGMQLMNVALGGSLCQHLVDEKPGVLDHLDVDGLRRPVHALEILPNTRLSQIANAGLRHEVNSAHFQGIETPAGRATVSAVAPDGTIEAIEVPDRRFALGVQWHPEELAGTVLSEALFAAFIRACHAGRS